MKETLGDHLRILRALARRNVERAAGLLEAHLARAESTALDRLARLDCRKRETLPAFLVPDEG